MKTVLLIRPDKAGDAIKTLPVIRALVRENLGYAYHLLLSPHNFSLFEKEAGITLHKLGDKLDIHFDIAILLPCDLNNESEKILADVPAHTKFSTRVLPLPRNTPALREETKNIATLVGNALNVNLIPSIYEVERAPLLTDADKLEAEVQMGEKMGKWLGLCPFAGTDNRTHPLKRWLKLVPKITKNSPFDHYFIFGTHADRTQMEELKKQSANPKNTHLCFPTSFRTLGAYLNRLDGLVAVDSGPLHLAHSFKIPSLGILSGGDVERWFKRVSPKDVLVPRGIFTRYPSVFEMWYSFKKWHSHLLDA